MRSIFELDPVIGVSLVLCLLTIVWVISTLRRYPGRTARFITGALGFVCVLQGLRLLEEQGVIHVVQNRHMAHLGELSMTVLYFALALVLKYFSSEHHKTKTHLRLAEAASRQPGTAKAPVKSACYE